MPCLNIKLLIATIEFYLVIVSFMLNDCILSTFWFTAKLSYALYVFKIFLSREIGHIPFKLIALLILYDGRISLGFKDILEVLSYDRTRFFMDC